MALNYVTKNDVKIRLGGKVRFTDDPDSEPDKMSEALLKRLIAEAEGDLEHDLSERYLVPFQHTDGTAFSTLPERPTREIIRTMAELKSVIRVLETDFGSGGATDSSKYTDKLQDRYDKMLGRLLERRKNSYNQWLKPPLPSLALAYHNQSADDGYAGQIYVTGQGDGGFPQAQINDPSENLWNGTIDDL